MSLTSYRAAPPRVDRVLLEEGAGRAGGPGSDLLFHALRRSTIGAEGFHGRVRDGIGCYAPRYGHQARFAGRELCGCLLMVKFAALGWRNPGFRRWCLPLGVGVGSRSSD